MFESDNGGWEEKHVPLVFQFSYRTVGSVEFPLLCRKATPFEPAISANVKPSAPNELSASALGYVTWSQPISVKYPLISVDRASIVYASQQYERQFVNLTGDYESYWAKFSSKTRSTLRRKVRKFSELSGGQIDFRTYRDVPQIGDFFERAIPLSKKTYQERHLGKGLPTTQDFRMSMMQLAAQGKIRAYLLFLRDEPIAYQLCPIRDGVLVYDKQGYDPEYAFLSPGTVLQVLILEALFGERVHRLLDFTEGEGEHKQLFATHSQLCADIFVLERRLRVFGPVIAHASMSTVSRVVRVGLRRVGLLGKARRLLRA